MHSNFSQNETTTSLFRICNALKVIIGTNWTHNSLVIIVGIVGHGSITLIVAWRVVVLCLCTPHGVHVCVCICMYVCTYNMYECIELSNCFINIRIVKPYA